MARSGTEPQPYTFNLRSFEGGVNVRDSPEIIPQNELRRGENIVLGERGAASKRLGSQSNGTFGAAPDRVLSLYTFYRAVSAPQVLMHTNAGKLYYTNDPSANPVVWTQIGTAVVSTTVPLSFETFNGKVYMCDGTNPYASWDGTTFTAFPAAPRGRYLRVWKDTMWISGFPSNPDRVYSSNAGDAETFGVSAWIDLGKGDGDIMTALAQDEIFLICSKRQRIAVIYDPVTFANRWADTGKGSESHFSWVHFDTDLFFLSRSGICQWRGDAPALPLSYKLDPLFRPDALNINALSLTVGYAFENRVGWCLPEVGQVLPTFQLEYFPRLAQKSGPGPFMFQRMPVAIVTRVRWQASDRLYGGHSTANKFLWLYSGVGTDDGVTFQALLETGMMDLGASERAKYVRYLRFLGRGKFQVQILRDFQVQAHESHVVDMITTPDYWSMSDTWGAGAWGPDSTVKEERINTDTYGRHIAFRLIDAETGIGSATLPVGSTNYSLTLGEWTVHSIQVEGSVLGVRD